MLQIIKNEGEDDDSRLPEIERKTTMHQNATNYSAFNNKQSRQQFAGHNVNVENKYNNSVIF